MHVFICFYHTFSLLASHGFSNLLAAAFRDFVVAVSRYLSAFPLLPWLPMLLLPLERRAEVADLDVCTDDGDKLVWGC